MRELYSSEPNLVKIVTSVQGRPTVPVSEPTVTLFAGNDKNNLELVAPLNAVEIDNGEYDIVIPQHYLKNKRFAAIQFNYELADYGVMQNRQTYDIASRLVNFEELNAALGAGLEIEYEVFTFIETDVRKIIESYCNQSFNSWQGEKLVQGEDGHIFLNENLEQLTAVTAGSKLIANQWIPLEGYVISEAGTSVYNPDRERTISFFHGRESKRNFMVQGLWGYSSIPAAVHQAALELAKGFLCDDIEYRRRYIDNIRNNDVRIEFHDKAYDDSTGNPIADQMLQPYRQFLYGAV